MTHETDAQSVTASLSAPEVQLVLTALRFLLAAEDDPAEIERLKVLIDRLEAS